MNKTIVIGLGLAGVGAALYLTGAFDSLMGGPVDEMQQGPTNLDQAMSALDPFAWDFSAYLDTTDPMTDPNVQAFLKVIRFAEGTSGPTGYNQIFATRGGPNSFTNYADHPRVAKQFKSGTKTLWTTAAGAYQFMAISQKSDGSGTTSVGTWDRLKAKLNLPDFSPASQDRAAVELISELGALADVKAGRFDQAIAKCRGTWASLPGATYGQPTKALPDLRNVYAQAGGTIAQA